MSKLDKVKAKAKSLGISGKITISTRKEKKYAIENQHGKIHFGAKGMKDFLDHNDSKRKERFHSRFKNNKGYNDKNSGLFYSRKLLW